MVSGVLVSTMEMAVVGSLAAYMVSSVSFMKDG